jgi:uncharacterized protein with NRDE domain
MCLLLLALDVVPDRPWLLLGNRDEFHARPTAAAHVWTDASDVIGGRDLAAGGSWLAVNRNGRFAAVTNVRTGLPQRGARSRGDLVAYFVRGLDSARDYATAIAAQRHEYGPFNLVVGDSESHWGVSSLEAQPWQFAHGIHVLSNGPCDAQWPKVRILRDRFDISIRSGKMGDAELLDLLTHNDRASDDDLPDTGVGIELERFLSSIFIRGAEYGTRASTLAYVQGTNNVILHERRFGPNGVANGESRLVI